MPESLRLLALVGTDEDPYREGGPWEYANTKGGRVFHVTQDEVYARTGQVLLTKEQIERGVARKGVKRSVWTKHNKDVYTTAEVKENPALIAGARKADHYHIAEERSSFATIGQVARSYGVAPERVEVKPAGSFLDLVE